MIQTVNIKSFTCLSDFSHDFTGHHVLITGKNAQGKSSILKFIQIALGNTDLISPESDGSGEVWVNKEGKEYHLKVKIKNGKSVVTITGDDGMSDSKKGTLANVMGATNFNIHEFVQLSNTEKGRKTQVDIFKTFFPADIIEGLRKLEANVKAKEEERIELGRDVKQKNAEVIANPLNYLIGKELDKYTFTDVSAKMTELKTLQEANVKVQKVMDNKVQRGNEIGQEKAVIADLQAKLDAKVALQEQAIEWLKTNVLADVTELEQTIKNATKSNKDFEDAEKLNKDRALLATMIDEQQDATVNIESQREAIKTSIKDMSTDIVPDLTFDENGLIYKGLLVHPNTHSTSERIRLGMLLKIAENKEIGTLFLENLESVDDEGMKAILEVVNENGMQLLGEEVRRNQEKLEFEIIGK